DDVCPEYQLVRLSLVGRRGLVGCQPALFDQLAGEGLGIFGSEPVRGETRLNFPQVIRRNHAGLGELPDEGFERDGHAEQPDTVRRVDGPRRGNSKCPLAPVTDSFYPKGVGKTGALRLGAWDSECGVRNTE